MTTEETLEYTHLFEQAWVLRDSPYLRDACEAISDWNDARLARVAERWWYQRAARRQKILDVLRETNPDNFKLRRAA